MILIIKKTMFLFKEIPGLNNSLKKTTMNLIKKFMILFQKKK